MTFFNAYLDGHLDPPEARTPHRLCGPQQTKHSAPSEMMILDEKAFELVHQHHTSMQGSDILCQLSGQAGKALQSC